MGRALYRKFRSRDWGEVIGQSHVTETLDNAVNQGKFSHAYLFSGPRGVGKTSVARILAHKINDLEYTDDEAHIDIIEIDAASNTSVEDIRDLREKVNIVPTLAKYKVYIIDEIHMLSKSAFNALLKTLEEPPAHVIFILATTDPQKLPETIISRTQHFLFRPFTIPDAVDGLKKIAKYEKIEMDDEATELIAELGDGSFRDSVSLLDQLSSGGKIITVEQVEELVGLPPKKQLEQLLKYVEANDAKSVIKLLDEAKVSGYQPSQIAKSLGALLRAKTLNSSSPENLTLMKQLLDVESSAKPEILLEIILLEATLKNGIELIAAKPTPQSSETIALPDTDKKLGTPQVKSATKPIKKSHDRQSFIDIWADILEQLRSDHHTLYALARMANARSTDDTITLEVTYPFHLKRLNEKSNRQIITDTISKVVGHPVSLEIILQEDSTLKPSGNTNPTGHKINSDDIPAPDNLEIINNVFGGSELLQSD